MERVFCSVLAFYIYCVLRNTDMQYHNAAMNCTFQPITEPDERGWKKWKCTRCDRPTDWTPDTADRIHARCRVPDRQGGLGDFVGRVLSYVGITQPRMAQVGWDCSGGCEERKAILNQVGWELSARLSRLFRRG